MKGNIRKMPTTTIIIGVLLVALLTEGLVLYNALKTIAEQDRKYAELKQIYFAEIKAVNSLKFDVLRKDAVIAELERLKGVAVSEVTYYAPTGNNTATGTVPDSARTVAVDPTVIPLGSDVYIEGIGWRKAEDTGGAIKGTDVDVFVDSEAEAQRGGRVLRTVLWRDSNAN